MLLFIHYLHEWCTLTKMIHNLFILIADCFYYKITKYYIVNHGVLVHNVQASFLDCMPNMQNLAPEGSYFLKTCCFLCAFFFLGGGGGGGGG